MGAKLIEYLQVCPLTSTINKEWAISSPPGGAKFLVRDEIANDENKRALKRVRRGELEKRGFSYRRTTIINADWIECKLWRCFVRNTS